MTPIYYDLHIHSGLSPCADNDMTPNDIVSMSVLNGLSLIAVTDHNTFANVAPVMKAAEGKKLIVLPGAEMETSEEVHVICLFYALEQALGFENAISPYFSKMKNRRDIFGDQLIYDEYDNITGEMERMLIAPVAISFDDLYNITKGHGGAFIPAHIDRDSYSVISNLGFLPPHLEFPTIEVSSRGFDGGFIGRNSGRFPNSRIICSSDAHHLWDIAGMDHQINLRERTPEAAVESLKTVYNPF